jgi:hypothetical protein
MDHGHPTGKLVRPVSASAIAHRKSIFFTPLLGRMSLSVPFYRGRQKTGGRKPGSRNMAKRISEQQLVEVLAAEQLSEEQFAEITPLHVLLRVMRAGDEAGAIVAPAVGPGCSLACVLAAHRSCRLVLPFPPDRLGRQMHRRMAGQVPPALRLVPFRPPPRPVARPAPGARWRRWLAVRP